MPDSYENTGSTAAYSSKMPAFENDADIKKAIQAYHYGDPVNATSSSFVSSWTDPATGILGKILYLKDEIDLLDTNKISKSFLTAKGNLISASASSTPAILSVGTNGFVLKANSATPTGLEWYNLDTTHLSLDPSSQTIVGNVLISKASATLTVSSTSGHSIFYVNRPSGSLGAIFLQTSGVARWGIMETEAAESGANAGSNFAIKNYADAGGTLSTALEINRATGLTTLSSLTVSGTMTGSLTGNASTATTLQTARNINGVSFNGSADITITAAAGTLTGTTLNSTVITSSLTSVGTIGTGVWQGTIIAAQYGGTGVNNSGKTITLGGNFTTSGAFATTLTVTNTTNVTLPTSGTLAVTQSSLSQFASTSSSDLAGVISDETGSGLLVFNNTPSLTSPAITTSITTPSTTFNLINSTATTVNFAGAATTLNIGNTSGTTTIASALTVSKKLTTVASAGVAGAGFGVSVGADPNVPSDGDIWVTSTAIKARVNGATIILGEASGGVPVYDASLINAGTLSSLRGGTGVSQSGTITVSGNISIGSSTHTVSFATSGNTSVTLPTSGTLVNTAVTTLSSLSSVGTITTGTWNSNNIDNLTTTHTLNIGYGATSSGNTKTINIGTNSGAGSTTNINIGSYEAGEIFIRSTGYLNVPENLKFGGSTPTIWTESNEFTLVPDWSSIVNIHGEYAQDTTLNLGYGATESGFVKTINIGTNSAAGSTTNIIIGSTAGTNSITLRGTVTASTATAGTNTTQVATTAFVTTAVSNLINGAPGALDTLDELAAALGDDANFASTVTNSLALKAPLASPALTGTPTAPTAAVDTNTTQIATTAYVVGQGYLKSATASSTYAPLASPTFTGTVTAATLDLTTAATSTTATSYFVETGSDGVVRPKTLANVRTEVVTTAAVNSAAATTVGTVTSGTWSATTIATNKGGTGLTSFTANKAVYSTSTSALTTGTLPVTAGGTGVTTSTGSVNVVLSNSPTFTGTVNMGTATLNVGYVNNASMSNAEFLNAAQFDQGYSVGTGTEWHTATKDYLLIAKDVAGDIDWIKIKPDGIDLRIEEGGLPALWTDPTHQISVQELSYLDGVTSSIQTQINSKAAADSPTFSGTPTAPTAAVDTNTTQLATTAYVIGQGYLKSATASSTYAPLASPTFTGTVNISQGKKVAITTKTSAYTLTTNDYLVVGTTGTWNATLPTAVGATGQEYVVKNTGTGVITVNTTSAQTIDGDTTFSLYEKDSLTVVSDGSNWVII